MRARAAGFALGLVVALAGILPGSAAGAPASALLAHLPEEAPSVLGVDLAAWRRAEPQATGAWLTTADGGELLSALSAGGLVLARDVDEVVVASYPAPGGGGRWADFALVARGRFQWPRLHDALVERGARPVTAPSDAWSAAAEGGILRFAPESSAGGPVVAGQWGSDVLVVASDRAAPFLRSGDGAVPHVVAAAEGGVPPAAPTWITVDASALVATAGQLASPVRHLTGWATLGDGLAISAVARTADEDAAGRLVAGLRLAALVGRARIDRASALAPLLGSLELSRSGSDVHATTSLGRDALRSATPTPAAGP